MKRKIQGMLIIIFGIFICTLPAWIDVFDYRSEQAEKNQLRDYKENEAKANKELLEYTNKIGLCINDKDYNTASQYLSICDKLNIVYASDSIQKVYLKYKMQVYSYKDSLFIIEQQVADKNWNKTKAGKIQSLQKNLNLIAKKILNNLLLLQICCIFDFN
ncbi:MAG: hypothetical protein WC979_00085 [Candidatus Pacearchaeota archaeon]|jgi:hypothetical protein|nr:hypothetical protein [Clostridia bacterium]